MYNMPNPTSKQIYQHQYLTCYNDLIQLHIPDSSNHMNDIWGGGFEGW